VKSHPSGPEEAGSQEPRRVPEPVRWALWDLDVERLDADADADSVLARVLEHGRLSDVRVILGLYGPERILRFFREVAHPLVTERTRQFWRSYFHAENETWPSPPDWRKSSAAPWID
jgi:hypothetical protein